MKFSDKFKTYYPQRFKGIYTSRGDNDLVSVRIRQKEGRDPSKWFDYQLESLVRISESYGNGKVHFTTRGDTELYGIHEADLGKVMQALEEADLDSRDSCGASVRNVMPCPSYVCPLARTDAVLISRRISRRFRHNPEYEYPLLPKRVKITVSACERGCATPGIMDVGIVATGEGKFDVYIGGGVGDHAFQSVRLFQGVGEEDLERISVAVVELLKREKEKRGFKWIVDKYGVEKTKEILVELMGEVKAEPSPQGETRLDVRKIARIYTRGGWLLTGEVREIVRLTKENFNFAILFNRQEVDIPLRSEEIATSLRYELLLPEEYSDRSGVESCIGNDFCPPAIISTNSLAEGVSKVLHEEGVKLNVKVSGCPHSCGRHQIGDIGFGAVMRGGKPMLEVWVGGDNFHLGRKVGEVEVDKYGEVIREMVRNGVEGVKGVLKEVLATDGSGKPDGSRSWGGEGHEVARHEVKGLQDEG